jgi:hypothetical protein
MFFPLGDVKICVMDDEEYFLSQIPKPQPTRLGATKIATLLKRVIQQRGYAAVQSADALKEAWVAAVGDDLSGKTRLGKVSRGALQVFVSNHVVKTELDFRVKEILRTLQDRLPDFGVQRLTVRVER